VQENEAVAAAVAVLVIHKGKLLLGKRIRNGRFEAWQCPGGYLLKGESLETAAKRICLLRAGLAITDIRYGPCTNNVFSECVPVKHSVTLYLLTNSFKLENNRQFTSQGYDWGWYDLDRLPEPLFLPLKILNDQHDLTQLIHH